MQLAEAFIQTGELADAVDALNQHLSEHPTDVIALRYRANVLLRLGDTHHLEQARTDSQVIMEPSADDWTRLSVIHKRLDDLDSAIQAMQSAIKSYPDDARLIERLLNLYVENKDIASALDLLNQQPETWQWSQWRGDLHSINADDPQAISAYQNALAQIDQLPSSPHVEAMRARLLLVLGHAYRRTRQIDSARQAYSDAKAIIPNDLSIDFNLGLLVALEGDTELAIELCHPIWDSANPILQSTMRDTLLANPIYQPLVETLGIENQSPP